MISHKTIISIVLISIFLMIGSCTNSRLAQTLSDEAEETGQEQNITNYDSYQLAIQNWKTLREVSGWMGRNFSYDMGRAVDLSETNRATNNVEIYPPSELFLVKRGICVDLARFGVETIRSILPEITTNYLMIEFVPIEIDGEIIRNHWLAIYMDGPDYYFFADSKRPGDISGPYDSVEDYILEYTRYRQREIVSYKELESYKKKQLKIKKEIRYS